MQREKKIARGTARDGKLRGEFGIDCGHQELHHKAENKCGKPTTPGDSRLDTHDSVEPDDRRHHCKTEREAVPKTQMAMECLAAMHGIG
jgi:hypothetical protein